MEQRKEEFSTLASLTPMWLKRKKIKNQEEKLAVVYWLFEFCNEIKAPDYIKEDMIRWLQEEGYKG